MGCGWLTPFPSRFTPGKVIQYLLYWKLGGPQSLSGWGRKISPPRGFHPRTVQPVARRYNDRAIQVHELDINRRMYLKVG